MEEKGMLAILFGLIGLVIKLTILGFVILITVDYIAGRRDWKWTHRITRMLIGGVQKAAGVVVREKAIEVKEDDLFEKIMS